MEVSFKLLMILVSLITSAFSYSTSCKINDLSYNLTYEAVGTYFLITSNNTFYHDASPDSYTSTIKYSLSIPTLNCSYE